MRIVVRYQCVRSVANAKVLDVIRMTVRQGRADTRIRAKGTGPIDRRVIAVAAQCAERRPLVGQIIVTPEDYSTTVCKCVIDWSSSNRLVIGPLQGL